MPRVLVLVLALVSCKPRPEPQPRDHAAPAPVVKEPARSPAHDAIARADFNRWAVRTNSAVYWTADANGNKSIDPDETAALMFYPDAPVWVDHGGFTPAFEAAYTTIVGAAKAPPPDPATPEGKRLDRVGKDLDAGMPTLVRTDLSASSADDKAFVRHMLTVAKLIDDLYLVQAGTKGLPAPADVASQSLFRRNQGPQCVGPKTEHDPDCSAYPAATRPKVYASVYPHAVGGHEQGDPEFCAALQKLPNAAAPFTVVEQTGSKPYSEVYKAQSAAIAAELVAAADAMKDPKEQPLVTYLHAAAKAFATNDWVPADEAWAKMTVDNSQWFVRVGPDEVYWESCALKAGYHLTFARINQGSRRWQDKLAPLQTEMEAAVAARAGAPYQVRKVTFHLPDFLDIIVNAGDDRDPIGGTIGQSLPNWGPVANSGRGRTIAMVNLFTDPDSAASRREQGASLLDAASMQAYPKSPEAGLIDTILHEVTHNLGPAHEYKLAGKTSSDIFGGPVATVLEELKAQTGALFLVELLRAKQLLTDEQALAAYTDAIVWAFGHVADGMYAGDKSRKTYGNVAAVHIGYLIEHGALVWDPAATAANGTDKGAFKIQRDKLVAVAGELMTQVAGIMARGDKAAADALLAKYVDSSTILPHALIAERFLRHPRGSLVYSVALTQSQ